MQFQIKNIVNNPQQLFEQKVDKVQKTLFPGRFDNKIEKNELPTIDLQQITYDRIFNLKDDMQSSKYIKQIESNLNNAKEYFQKSVKFSDKISKYVFNSQQLQDNQRFAIQKKQFKKKVLEDVIDNQSEQDKSDTQSRQVSVSESIDMLSMQGKHRAQARDSLLSSNDGVSVVNSRPISISEFKKSRKKKQGSENDDDDLDEDLNRIQNIKQLTYEDYDKLPTEIDDISEYLEDKPANQAKTLDQHIKMLNLGPISNDPEFQALSLIEQHREIINQDDINKISYNFPKEVSIDDKHLQQQQLQQINHLSRNIMCQHDEYRKQQAIVRKKLIIDQDVMINQKDVTLEDISNIVGDRISENELVKMVDPQHIDDNLKKAQFQTKDLDKVLKEFYDQTRKSDYKNTMYEFKTYEYEIKLLKQLQRISQLQDKSCGIEDVEVVEETKSGIDWLFEDLHHIKKAKDDSKYFCDNTQIGDIIKLQIYNKFETKMYQLLRVILFGNNQTKSKTDCLVRLKEILQNPQQLVGQWIGRRRKADILLEFLKDFQEVIEIDSMKMKEIDQKRKEIYTEEITKLIETKKPRYLKDYEKGIQKMKQQRLSQKSDKDLTQSTKRKR